MARSAEGWKLYYDERRDTHYVRFRHQGKRYTLATGQSDPGEAGKAAARLYAEVVSGRRKKAWGVGGGSVSDRPLKLLLAEWIDAAGSSLDPKTLDQYTMYGRAHWLPYFSTLDRVTAASCADYWRARLRAVKIGTVRKELSALRVFLSWCEEHGFVEKAPVITSPPKTSTGKTVWKREPIALSESEVRRILANLPEWAIARKSGGKRIAVRARFEFAWETSMRPETIDELRAPENYRKRGRILVLGDEQDKNRMGREIPLTPAARRCLSRVCPEVGLIFGAHDYRVVLRKAARAAGLPPARAQRVTEQCFRHSRLTYWAETNGTNLPGIQYLAGHKHATTTAKYIKSGLRAAEQVLKGAR